MFIKNVFKPMSFHSALNILPKTKGPNKMDSLNPIANTHTTADLQYLKPLQGGVRNSHDINLANYISVSPKKDKGCVYNPYQRKYMFNSRGSHPPLNTNKTSYNFACIDSFQIACFSQNNAEKYMQPITRLQTKSNKKTI